MTDSVRIVLAFAVMQVLLLVVLVLALPWLRPRVLWARRRWAELQGWAAAKPWRAPLVATLVGGGTASVVAMAYLVNAQIVSKLVILVTLPFAMALADGIDKIRRPEHPMADEWRRRHWHGRW